MRKNYNREDIIKLVEEEDVEFIRLQFTDISGNLKNLAITAGQLEKALDNDCMFDGSSIEGLPMWRSRTCICTRITARWKFFRGDPSRERWRA